MVKRKSHILALAVLNLLIAPSCIKFKVPTKPKQVVKAAETDEESEAPTAKVPRIVHKAHLPEGWYNQNPQLLTTEIEDYLASAQHNFYVEADPNAIRAMIVPHAGHYYSGLCAATAYQTLTTTKNLNAKNYQNNNIRRVVILAPSHTTYFDGIALPDYTVYQTPLGEIDVDFKVLQKLATHHKHFKELGKAHQTEHAIEIQLPFLQKLISHFKIVPLVVGNLKNADSINEISKALQDVIDDHTLVVVSSDFMHHGNDYQYKPFDNHIINQVKYVDSLAIKSIINKSQREFENILQETGSTICGQNPIRLLLNIMPQKYSKQLSARLACYYTSSHLTRARKQTSMINLSKLIGGMPDGLAQSSVSYASIVFTDQDISKLKKENQVTGYEKQSLVTQARETIENQFLPEAQRTPAHLLWPVLSPGVEKAAGTFVTLNTLEGKLRGCIGTILSYEPLYKTVPLMAQSAAFKDTRFKPLDKTELSSLLVDVSVLTPPEEVSSFHEIVLGKHGIILNKFEKDGKLKASAVFLPSVPTAQRWNLRTTLEQLSIKAGLGQDGWLEGAELQVFEGFEIHELQG